MAFWLVIILAFVLRIVNLNQSLWLDEAINIVYAKSSHFWWFVTKYSIGDFHPPGWFAILWIWTHLFGFSEIISRLPSVILGAGTVGLTYLLGRDLFSKKVGLLSSFLLAIAPLHVYYSQEARMYAFAAFAVTLSFYFLNLLTLKKRWANLGYILSLILILYSDYLAYLVIPVQMLYFILIRKINVKILPKLLIALATLVPWLSIFPMQLQTGISKSMTLPEYGNVVGGSNAKDLLLIPLKIFFGKFTLLNKTLYTAISILAGIIYGSIFIYIFKKLDQAKILLISWILLPIVLAFLISFFIPVLSYFRMLFILPAFYLIIGNSIESLPKKVATMAVVIICLISSVSLLAYYINPRFQREDWRGAVNFLSQKMDVESVVIFENNGIPAPVRYYSPDLSKFKPGLSSDLVSSLAGKSKIYLFEYLVDIYDPQRLVEENFRDLGFKVKEIYDFQGVGLIKLYVR